MPRRPRQSFGGNTGTGIWWRKRFINDDDDDDEEAAVDKKEDVVLNNDDLPSDGEDNSDDIPRTEDVEGEEDDDGEDGSPSDSRQGSRVSIGWDDDLCRPIYIRPESEASNSDAAISSEGDEDGNEGTDDEKDGEDVEGDTTTKDNDKQDLTKPFVLPEAVQEAKTRGRKRPKTFATRNVVRRPLSLILSQTQEEEEQASGSEDSGNEDEQTSNKRSRTDSPHNMDSLATLAPMKFKVNARRISTSPFVQHSDNVSDDDASLAFPVEATETSIQKTATTSPLKRQRAFFEDLDKTQKLKLDASFSPTVSGKVTRTSRRFDFTSPRVNQEYQKYVEATEESGVTPLSIKDFVKSRKLHFETKGGELFDGFLDEC
ncbi:MAG: hypothetical protein SGILL_001389 [Bacillariaceae sp.]